MPTQEEFTAAMKAAVEERGRDWHYPDPEVAPEWFARDGVGACRYRLEDGSPACIVGTALSKLQLLDRAADFEGKDAAILISALGFDEDTASAASCAQGAQDFGDSWGEALDQYLESIGEKTAEAA